LGALGADALEQGGGRFVLAALAAEPGPILLQGARGPVEFRKVTLTSVE